MIAPITIITTSEEAASKSQCFTDLFIQITSIAEVGMMNPNQSHTATKAPLPHVIGPIEREDIQRMPASTKAVMKFIRRFHAICGIISLNFSFPVGWMSANLIQSFPNKGP